ncbi:MAG TPA: hypothetical protein VHE13_02645 [Opitutus sp.]|nr:hypothetical protein [Opitutus sp.]
MNPVASEKEIIGGYAVAGATMLLGMYLGLRMNDGHADVFVMRTFTLIAALVVLKYTFAWGRHRGFPVRRVDGTISLENLLSNLIAAVVVFFGLILMGAPFLPLLVPGR